MCISSDTWLFLFKDNFFQKEHVCGGKKTKVSLPGGDYVGKNIFQDRFRTDLSFEVLKRVQRSKNCTFKKRPANIEGICELVVSSLGELGLVQIREKRSPILFMYVLVAIANNW